MNILFFIRRARINLNGNVPIFCRLSVNGTKQTFSTELRCEPQKWNSKTKKIIGNALLTKETNNTLDKIKANLIRKFEELDNNHIKITAKQWLLFYRDNLTVCPTFFELMDMFLDIQKKRVEVKEIGMDNLRRNQFIANHLKNYFIDIKKPDILAKDVTRADFEKIKLFLLAIPLYPTYVGDIMLLAKRTLIYGVHNDYLDKNVFDGLFVANPPDKEPEYLTIDEIQQLNDLENLTGRMLDTRDYFVFCCYCGLAYVDFNNLKFESVIMEDKDKYWLKGWREKGKKKYGEFILPLHPIARKILDEKGGADKMPKASNQVFNKYLKKLQELTNIQTTLCCHLARKTFAHHALNTWHIPTESILKMCGWESDKMLKKYARVKIEKIENDTKIWFQ